MPPVARRAALEVVGLVAGDLRLRPLVRAPRLVAKPVDRGCGIRLRDLELATLARLPGAQHPGEQSQRTEDRARVDPDRHVLRHVDEAVVVDLGLDDSGPRVVRDAVARHVAIRTGHAVAGDRAEHDARIHLAQRVESEAAAIEASGTHCLDDGVGIAHELEERLASDLGAEVENDALLAPADVQEEERDAFDDRPRHTPAVVTLRRFDLDDVGAEIGEVGREVARPEHRNLDDAQAGERSRSFGGHGRANYPADFRSCLGSLTSAPASARAAGAAGCRRCRSCPARSRRCGRAAARRRVRPSPTPRTSPTAGGTPRCWR